MLTTFTSYGRIDEFTQGKIIGQLQPRQGSHTSEMTELLRKVDLLIERHDDKNCAEATKESREQ